MRDRERIQTKASSIPTNAFNQAETGLFRKRPFVVQAETETDTDTHPLPDLQTQLERGARFNQSLSRMKVYGNRPVIQPKIAVGAPGDRYEQEADQVADRVMNMKAPTANPQSVQRQEEEQAEESVQMQSLAPSITPLVQREASLNEEPEEQVQPKAIQREEASPEEEPEEQVQPKTIQREASLEEEPEEQVQPKTIQREASLEEEPEEQVQPKTIQCKEQEEPLPTKPSVQRAGQDGGFQASPSIESRLASQKGGGSPLSDEVRSFMEPRIGADFSQVRVHTDGEAVQMNRELGAQAFTHGSDIYFGSGRYNPESIDGKRLLAHELTHTIQQSGGERIQSKTVEGFLQCKIVNIGTEKVDVANDKQEEEARRIIQDIKDKYGIDISSHSGINAIKKDYPSVPDAVKNSLKTKEWKFKELQALEKALAHFAPILGANRKSSSREFDDQEVTSTSKVDQAIDMDDPSGVLDNDSLGEYFESSKNFSMFTAGENAKGEFGDNAKELEGTAVHELAHGLLKYALPDYVKALDYWTDEDTKSRKKGAEAPITKYGAENASEDLSEAVMYYFLEPETLKKGKGKPDGKPGNPCPKRYALIETMVKNWNPKKRKGEPGDFPESKKKKV